ncbi:uncharacterized protein J4E88_007924, partial [Alternaria novae-zelandiae]|uniref:uncharacterized protein n=1 Tax=Alternaria novae-zelandiae TaxID=430562 RepID=UPI0020C43125
AKTTSVKPWDDSLSSGSFSRPRKNKDIRTALVITTNPPSANIPASPTFARLAICSVNAVLIGTSKMARSIAASSARANGRQMQTVVMVVERYQREVKIIRESEARWWKLEVEKMRR